MTKLYELIRKNEIVKHKKYQEFLVNLVEGLIKSRSVVFTEIADKIEFNVKPESLERRIQRFFQKVAFNYFELGLLLLSFVHHSGLLLSIDRTEWDFGKTQINILCVIVSIGKMGIPLYFEFLDNKSGNSNAEDRIKTMQKLIEMIGKDRINLLVMDREFIGHKWLRWLKQEKIDFCVRVPKHHKILLANGERLDAETFLGNARYRIIEGAIVDLVVLNICLSYDAKGELLYLIGTKPAKELKKIYKKRWTIEVFFQALKSRGFHLEKSCLRDLEKYKKLFAVVSLAYTICWATGIEDGRKNPVKRKNHGYPQYSVFRRGLNLIRKFYKKQILEPIQEAINKACIRRYRMNI